MSDLFIVRLPDKVYRLARTESRFFEISETDILANPFLGLIPNAIEVDAQTVADLVAKSEARAQQLGRVETSLKEWIAFRQSRIGKPKRKLRLQKQEASN